MNSRRAFSALVVMVCSFLFLPACTRPTGGGGGGGEGQLNNTRLTFSAPNGNCQQTVGATALNPVRLNPGDRITLTAQGGGSAHLKFPIPSTTSSCTSPFRDASGACQWDFDIPAGGSTTTGPAGGPASTTYPYASLSINGAPCNLNGGLGPLGMRMRP